MKELSVQFHEHVFRPFPAGLAYVSAGNTLGWSSPYIPRLMRNDSSIHITPDQSSWIASVPEFAVMVATVPAFYLLNVWGRKRVLQIPPFLIVVAWIILYFANSYAEIVVSRLLCGVALSIILMVGPMYTSEIAQDSIRGTLGTIFQIMINVGVLFVYVVGPYVSMKVLSLIACAFPILFALLFFWMPESPYYYIIKNDIDSAEKSLTRLRGKTDSVAIKSELENMIKSVEEQNGSLKNLFVVKTSRRALILSIVLMTLQAWSGVISILSYATTIFIRSGSDLDADLSSIILGVVQLVMSIFPSLIVDRVGRRPLLFLSFAGCALSLAAEGVYFYLKDVAGKDVSSLGWLPLTALIFFIVVYMLGLGPVPWAMVSEMLPVSVKGKAMCIITFEYAFVQLMSVKLFQVISYKWGDYVSFWIFGSICVVGCFFVLFCLPETKGKSFQQIIEELGGNEEKPSER